ncbi:hypothetical protein DLP05_115 [Stenotrophomonas phage vB_SmaS_DLP_5]|uniref:Uncharacterized protein n=1 Tax=Stenotrophomonas phage vB_SmaS_DLP_5 TaxID=2044561 RepID=A0A2D2W2K8_9CAUD|nr:hypothetical protein FDJ07_gp106 [Stenotrophomonas phage vB_SmaS_DLP_5]ATS92371.1 hypothetical protein DLP05_115 [Stenotrophomonas phage vB_SmaS_DLP_5]
MSRWPSQKTAKEEIQALLDSNDRAVYRAIILINDRQTASEKAHNAAEEENGEGWSKFDAEFMSNMAHAIRQYGKLTERQMEFARPKIKRYWKQLMIISNEKGEAA